VTTETKTKRKPRRNYERELKNLAEFCRISADIYQQFAAHCTEDKLMAERFTSRRDTLLDVLARLEHK